MILVDSSVWIDRFANRNTAQVNLLSDLLANQQQVVMGDLMLVEVLQGTRDARHFDQTLGRLGDYPRLTVSTPWVAIQAARNYQYLRGLGVTIRKTIDTLIATRCIVDRMPLLYSDRDFDPFVQHLGLISALDASGVN